MTIHRYLRMVAGIMVLGSLALGHFVSPKWLWLTAFVGLNLLQSAFSDWCPLISMLKKWGVPESASGARNA